MGRPGSVASESDPAPETTTWDMEVPNSSTLRRTRSIRCECVPWASSSTFLEAACMPENISSRDKTTCSASPHPHPPHTSAHTPQERKRNPRVLSKGKRPVPQQGYVESMSNGGALWIDPTRIQTSTGSWTWRPNPDSVGEVLKSAKHIHTKNRVLYSIH